MPLLHENPANFSTSPNLPPFFLNPPLLMVCVKWKARRGAAKMKSTPENSSGAAPPHSLAQQHVVGVCFQATHPRRAGRWWDIVYWPGPQRGEGGGEGGRGRGRSLEQDLTRPSCKEPVWKRLAPLNTVTG